MFDFGIFFRALAWTIREVHWNCCFKVTNRFLIYNLAACNVSILSYNSFWSLFKTLFFCFSFFLFFFTLVIHFRRTYWNFRIIWLFNFCWLLNFICLFNVFFFWLFCFCFRFKYFDPFYCSLYWKKTKQTRQTNLNHYIWKHYIKNYSGHGTNKNCRKHNICEPIVNTSGIFCGMLLVKSHQESCDWSCKYNETADSYCCFCIHWVKDHKHWDNYTSTSLSTHYRDYHK